MRKALQELEDRSPANNTPDSNVSLHVRDVVAGVQSGDLVLIKRSTLRDMIDLLQA